MNTPKGTNITWRRNQRFCHYSFIIRGHIYHTIFPIAVRSAVHGLEEAVEEVAVVGPGVGAAQDRVGDGLATLVGDAKGLVVAQFRGNVGGEEQLALVGFEEELERVEPLGPAVGRLVDE